MKIYERMDYISLTEEEIIKLISSSACGSVTGSCYGSSSCGCTYGT